jgi:tRNA (guanine-N7-)-methyltransferase
MSFGLSRGKTLVTEGVGIEGSTLPDFDEHDRAASRIDPRTWFPAPERPFEIEIGSGKGTFLVQEAQVRADVNFLGIERAAEFYRYAADRVRRHGLDHVRVLHADATEFIRYRCPDAIAGVIHLYFSDPWPKKRHHKRRVLQLRSLDDMHRVLVANGELRLVTDHDELWAWYETLAGEVDDRFERMPFATPASAASGEFVGTNYERKFTREGRPFHAMTLRRRA